MIGNTASTFLPFPQPVRLKQIKQKHDRTQAPGQRVGPEDHPDGRDEVNGDGDIGDTDHTPADHHDDHGDDGFSGTPEDSGGAVGEGQQEVEKSCSPGLEGSIPDDLGGSVEGRDHVRNEEKHGHTYQLCQGDGAEHAEPGSFFHPVISFCTDILAGKGSHGEGEAGHRKESKAFHLGVGAAAGHGHFSEGIDVGLDHHVGQGDDGILKACRKTVGDDLPEHKTIHADLFQGNPVFLRTSQELPETEGGA